MSELSSSRVFSDLGVQQEPYLLAPPFGPPLAPELASLPLFTPRHLMPPTVLRWLYVDFNSYFASVEQQMQPHLRGKPIAVVPVETDSTCAIAASYEAKAYGIKTGTPIWEAKQKCPELICVLGRHEHYVAYHERIVEEINRHIPVEAVCSIDEMACRLMDNEAPLAAAIAIAHNIKRGLARNIGAYVRCSIGISSNRYLAKIATDMKKPNGLTILNSADLPGRLFELNLNDLPGIGRNMEKRLASCGILTMPQLWALSPLEMRKIWHNIWGERLWHLLRGADLEEIPTERRTVGHSHVMAPELRPVHKARLVVRRLTLKAASRLRRMDYFAGAMAFSARVDGGNFQGARLAAHIRFWPAQDSFSFLTALDQLWREAVVLHGAKRLRKVSITLYELTPAQQQPAQLFEAVPQSIEQKRLKSLRMSHALDKINQNYGRDTISIGIMPSEGRSFSGTKIAFTRIPDASEFKE